MVKIRSKSIANFFEALFLVVLFVFQIYWLPEEVLRSEPATGGDTGSHFWPVYVLHHFGLPHWTIRSWNPGNLGGEGHLVHYFPFPFLLMAIAGFFIPLGAAFNLGTILPVVALPFSIYFCLYRWKLPPLARAVGTTFSLFALYNESFTMWGGNTLSTLSGQFAHMYALNFLFIGLGELYREIERKQVPFMSGVIFSLCAISHAYIYISIPLLLLFFLLLIDVGSILRRTCTLAISAAGSFALSLWFLIPMVLNGQWTTPHSFNWVFTHFLEEVFPAIFEFPTFLCALSIALLPLSQKTKERDDAIRKAVYWLLVAALYVGFFFIFRWLKLVDARAIPQVQLFFCIGAGVLSATVLSSYHYLIRAPLALAIMIFGFYSTSQEIVRYPQWMKFNYSSWSASEKYDDFLSLSKALKGSLSDLRVLAEHNGTANFVGSERVFEMLPYFANRATGESLYLQSTVLAPMMFYLQAEISKDPSCPFSPTWPCKPFSLSAAEERLRLVGAGTLILSSEALLEDASKQDYLEPNGEFGGWHLFNLKEPPRNNFFLQQVPEEVDLSNWRRTFWQWFLDYSNSSQRFLFANPLKVKVPAEDQWIVPSECKASLTADFSGLKLHTNCPGKVHVLRYAFSPWFNIKGADGPLLVSPGFIAVIPREQDVTLTFGAVPVWRYTRWFSIASFLALAFGYFYSKRNPHWQHKLQFGLRHMTYVSRLSNSSSSVYQVSAGVINRLKNCQALIVFIIAYIGLSLHFGSWVFWHWRNLRLEGLGIESFQQDWGSLQKNLAVDGSPIIVGGKVYQQGLGTHAKSHIKIKLDRGSEVFSGACALEDNYKNASLRCTVIIEGDEVAVLPDLNADNQISPFELKVAGKRNIELIIESLADTIDGAHGVWIDLRNAPID